MKRLLNIIVLTLALLGLTVPGLMADTSVSRCPRGALWIHGQSVAGLPVPAEASGLPAPIRQSVCPDHGIITAAALSLTAPRRALPLASSPLEPLAVLSEAELPPPRGL